MQPNIAIKFTGYVEWILICRFGEKICYNSRIFPSWLLFGVPCM